MSITCDLAHSGEEELYEFGVTGRIFVPLCPRITEGLQDWDELEDFVFNVSPLCSTKVNQHCHGNIGIRGLPGTRLATYLPLQRQKSDEMLLACESLLSINSPRSFDSFSRESLHGKHGLPQLRCVEGCRI